MSTKNVNGKPTIFKTETKEYTNGAGQYKQRRYFFILGVPIGYKYAKKDGKKTI